MSSPSRFSSLAFSPLSSLLPLLAILGSVSCLAIGTSWAKHSLFPLIGAQGTTAIRVAFSALIMLLAWRPWRWRLARADLRLVAIYGAALGAMYLLFYMAIQRIPFGIAVAIEFSGPLAIALFTSRRPLDFLWILLAVTGLALLLPLGHNAGTLDPVGVLYALAAAVFWGAYILVGKRIGHLHIGQSVSLGLTVAALVAVPVGVMHAGSALLSPHVLTVGIGIAILSCAIPIMLEMAALRRVAPSTFGIMISVEPAVSALIAMVLLKEFLSTTQWLAIGLIVSASVGCALRSRPVAAAPAATARTRPEPI